MTTIDRDLLKAIRPEIDAALKAVAEKFGLDSLKCGNATYDPRANNFTMKLDGIASGGVDKGAARYDSAVRFDTALPPRGAEIATGGRKFKVSGMNTTGSKVTAVGPDGKTYLLKTDAVKRIWATQCAPVQALAAH